ncbi:enoyl-CoA-hydratase DpgB [Streptomyces sp. NPDC088258]|uniref:enoyl-CoA-hydratase DpgB n=1 Tax=Streptomyces sp. NPDC088258 TaxID=3365849 RepID=UPI0037F15560
MKTEPDRTPLPDGLGILARLDGGGPLPELTAALNALCEEAGEQRERTVVALRCTPPPPGARAWPGDVSIHEVNRWERAVRRLERLDNVTVAAAQGVCGGPVLDLLLAADFRIGTPDLKLVLPVNQGQFWPGMTLYRLVRHIGPARARRLVLWASDIPLPDAVELGIVDQISDDVTGAVRDAALLRGGPPDGEVGIRRRLLEEAASAEYQDAFGAHLAACDRELRRLRDSGPGPSAGTAAGGAGAAG